MDQLSSRWNRFALRCGLAAVCMFTVIVGAAATARGQCSPQELAKLIASDAAGDDWLGRSVAVSGDTAVVGSYQDDDAGSVSGSAYVFVRVNGVWTQQAKLTASDAAAGDQFGYSVAVSENRAVIGAFTDDHVGGEDAGSAYVFDMPPGGWSNMNETAKLIASDAAVSDAFGISVAVSGNAVVVGATGVTPAGSAYVFVALNGAWTQQAKLTASVIVWNGGFGDSVAISGHRVVIGASLDNPGAGSGAGSAYVFVKPPGGWVDMNETAKITATDAAAGDRLGYSVAISGTTAVIGAPEDDHGAWSDAGSAYVFIPINGVWTQQAKLISSDASTLALFGWSVAVSGDLAVIGAPLDSPSLFRAGSAYVFVHSGGGWTEEAKMTASDAGANDQFGTSVAVSGDIAVSGAVWDGHAGGFRAGSAYVHELGCAFACCPGDFDGNNVVTDADVSNFVTALLAGTPCPGPPACCQGDFNSDGLVDGSDIPGSVAKLLAGGACP